MSNEYPISVQKRIEKLHKFKHWVTSEVLPTLRRTGTYSLNSSTPDKPKYPDKPEGMSDEEYELKDRIINAWKAEDCDTMLLETTRLLSYKNSQIKELVDENITLRADNISLTRSILDWSDRAKLNAGIRKLAYHAHMSIDYMWGMFYKQLEYGYSICVKRRGDKPYISHIKEYEWDSVMTLFCAMCEAYGQSPTKMLQLQFEFDKISNTVRPLLADKATKTSKERSLND